MTRNHYLVLIGLGLLIILLVMPQSVLERTAYRWFNTTNKVGEVKEVIGKAEKTIGLSTQRFAVNGGDTVGAGDIYITHGDSKILFTFDPPFWLMPYSKIEFLKTDDEVTGHLIYGEIKKLPANPEATPILLTYEEKTIDAESFSSSEDAILTPLASNEEFKDLAKGDGVPQNLTEKQIFHALVNQKRFFQACLIKLYKKENGKIKGGETVFDLFIQVNGVIEKATLNKTDIQDQEYINCLKQVFARVHFKDLKLKEPLHALFPLNVEMP